MASKFLVRKLLLPSGWHARLACGSTWALLVLLAAVCLSGCATPNGPSIEAFTKSAGPPKAGQARVIVYREPLTYQIMDRTYPVMLDGQPMGSNLTAGTFVSADRPAGRHQLSLDMWDTPGVTRVDFNAVAGRTHYFVVRMSDKGKAIAAGSVLFGLSGYAIAAVATSGDDKGGMDLVSVDEPTARKALAELRQADPYAAGEFTRQVRVHDRAGRIGAGTTLSMIATRYPHQSRSRSSSTLSGCQKRSRDQRLMGAVSFAIVAY